MIKKPEIVQLGAEILRQTARPIDDFTLPDLQALITTLQSVMQASNGVGIAAPQLGESRQLIIVASRPTARYPKAPDMPPIVMINPHFEVLDAAQHKDWEGCLSIPGIRALVPRYRAVNVHYQDSQGQPKEIALQDFPARIFQHEFDHLHGLVYLDRVESNRDIVTESEFFKLIAA